MHSLRILVCLLVAHAVYSVPITRSDSAESDDIEQELIRHHHATTDDDAVSGQAGTDKTKATDDSAAADAKVKVSDVSGLDMESLYDFTVADVLADIIYELKKNPVLLEQLIESERKKIERRIEEMSTERQDSYGGDLSNIQNPAKLLQQVQPTQVENKADTSGMENESENQNEDKRTQEIIDNNYAHNDVSQETRDLETYLNNANMPPAGASNADVSGGTVSGTSDDAAAELNAPHDTANNDAQNTQGNGMTGYEMYQWMSHLPGFHPVFNGPTHAKQGFLPQAKSTDQTGETKPDTKQASS